MDKVEQADKDFKQVLLLEPMHKQALLNKAITSLKLKNYKETIEDPTAVIKTNANSEKHYLNRGIAYMNLKQYKEAEIDFNKAIELDEDFAIAWFNRANARNMLEQPDNACADMRQSARLGYKAAFEYIPSLCEDFNMAQKK